MKKRLLSLALCLVLCLGLFPFGVLAADEATTAVAEVTQTGTDGKTVKTEYDTLEAALKAAQSSSFATNSGTSSTVQSAEVTLLADINDTITVSTIYPKSLTLNLNDYTLSGASNTDLSIYRVLTLSNTAYPNHPFIVKNGKIVNNANKEGHAAIGVSTGTMILENVVVTGTGKTYSVNVLGGGKLEVKGNCIFNGTVYVNGDGSAKLSGGVYNNGICLNNKPDTYYAEMLAPGYVFAGESGEYIPASELKNASPQYLKVVACNHRDNTDASTFDSNTDVCTRCNYTCTHTDGFNENGTCKTCLKPFVATVTKDDVTHAYTTLGDALSAATNGDTVKLLTDADAVTINETGVKLDANGKTITKLTATAPATLSDLLPEGYAYKSGGEWVSDLNKSELESVTMAVAPIQSLRIAADNTNVTYGQPVTVTATATLGGEITGISYQWDCKAQDATVRTNDVGQSWTQTLNAGTYTFTCKATCDGYTITSNEVTVTVGKAAGSIANKAEGGYATAYTYGQEIPTPVKDNFTTNSEGNLTYTWDKTPENAGSYLLTVTVAEDDNHTAATLKIPVTINPKIVENPSITVAAGSVYDGTEQKPAVTVKDGDTVIDPSEYTVSYDNNINAGSEATVILTDKEGGNYTVSGRTTFSIAKATLDGVSVKQSEALTYNSKAQTAKVTTTAAARGGQAVTFTYSTEETGTYGELPAFPGAGTYTLYYKASAANHETASGSFQVVIGQAPVTVRASDKSAYVGSTAPDLSKPELGKDYTISGLFGEDTLKTAPKLSYVLTPDMSKVGSAEIKIEGAEVGANYKLDYQNGKLNITTRPSSGGSGSTGTKTDTVKNPDGSTTKTETKADGSRTETTTATTPGGSTGSTVTKTDANGSSRTEASAKLSDQDVKTAQETGGAVTVPVQGIEAAKDASTATEITIDLPKAADKTTVEIPVDNVTSGTVAVIVHADGTEEIAKSSKPTEDGVQLEIDGSTTVKIIDNSKDFIDTRNHWSRDEVNFVAARGLFNGVGNNLFGVSLPMTRGMVNTVLARLSGVDTNGGSTWYEKGTEWAMKNGITDGTNPTGNVTREQLATLLYRYAGSPDVSGTLRFADNASISDYARNALLWANQKGIMSGVGNNTIAPKANAQRAQVAAMFARYLKNL
jgi:hypothetical protein